MANLKNAVTRDKTDDVAVRISITLKLITKMIRRQTRLNRVTMNMTCKS